MLKSLILEMFGAYVPYTYSQVIDDVEYSIIPNGLSGVDIPWLCGFVLFALTFYCVMRLVGVLLNDK